MATYEHTGDLKKGGYFVHYRDDFRRCSWAFVTASVSGPLVNLQVITNGPEQMIWKPRTIHGSGKCQWHWPDQCAMSDDEIKADEAKPAAAKEK